MLGYACMNVHVVQGVLCILVIILLGAAAHFIVFMVMTVHQWS